MSDHTFQLAMSLLRQRHGSKFITPATTADQRRYFGEDQRVEITTTYASGEQFIRRGRIGYTGGWQPALLLVHRRGSSGSWDTLGVNDMVTALIDSRGRRHPIN